MLGSLIGKILAVLFIALSVAVNFGPDKWAIYLVDGLPSFVTPNLLRWMLLALCFLFLACLILAPLDRRR
jgi:hypothetical protein